MYGEIIAFIGLILYYFTVQMSEFMWIFVDGLTVPVSWALTMAKPAPKLSPFRPTARLLGPETIISVVGQIIIDIFFVSIAVVSLFRQSFFKCNEFDGTHADLRKWWELPDNYEGAVIGIVLTYQIINAACAFNIGNRYREGFWKNKTFLAVYFSAFLILAVILLSDPNPIGCIFRINCGTQSALESLGYKVWFNAPKQYFNHLGHNVIPVYFRWQLLFIVLLNCAAGLIWEGVVITGPVRAWAKRKFDRKFLVAKKELKL
jgi:cation-transporting ATPase 13A3/4/5